MIRYYGLRRAVRYRTVLVGTVASAVRVSHSGAVALAEAVAAGICLYSIDDASVLYNCIHTSLLIRKAIGMHT